MPQTLNPVVLHLLLFTLQAEPGGHGCGNRAVATFPGAHARGAGGGQEPQEPQAGVLLGLPGGFITHTTFYSPFRRHSPVLCPNPCIHLSATHNDIHHVLQAFGRIRHNKLVYFDGDGTSLKAQLVMVRIEACNAYSLFGTMVGDVLPRGVSSGLGGQRELVAA